MAVRLSSLDLGRRTAVVRALDDAGDEFPHVLRGTLAGLFHEPGWHVVVAFEREQPLRPPVAGVLDEARAWADERACRLSVTPLRDVVGLTMPV